MTASDIHSKTPQWLPQLSIPLDLPSTLYWWDHCRWTLLWKKEDDDQCIFEMIHILVVWSVSKDSNVRFYKWSCDVFIFASQVSDSCTLILIYFYTKDENIWSSEKIFLIIVFSNDSERYKITIFFFRFFFLNSFTFIVAATMLPMRALLVTHPAHKWVCQSQLDVKSTSTYITFTRCHFHLFLVS